MIQNGHSIPTKQLHHRRNLTEVVNYYEENDQQHDFSQDLFMHRFKNHQNSLRTKFKKYLQQKKSLFPNTFNSLNQSQHQQQAEQIQNIRIIRQKKKKLIQDLNQSMNESRYAITKKQSYEQTYNLLSNKMKRVQRLRLQRKSEVLQMQQTLKSINKQIKEQKLYLKAKVDESKHSLLESRMWNSHKKMVIAKHVRNQTEEYQEKISKNKFSILRQNSNKCRTVKEQLKKVELNVSRVYEEKKGRAQEMKLQRLFRELAEKEEIKIISARIKKDTKNKITQMQNKTLDLQKKIRQYRNSLGQRRLDPPQRISLPKWNRMHNTSEHGLSTNSEFLSLTNNDNYQGEPFEDVQ